MLQVRRSSVGPSQGSPSKNGPLHSLLLAFSPPPQVTLQESHSDHCLHTPLTRTIVIVTLIKIYGKINGKFSFSKKKPRIVPGHDAATHIFSCVSSPVQFMPPYSGPTQVLFRHWVPFAHVTEHSDQSAQAVHTPSTRKQRIPRSISCLKNRLFKEHNCKQCLFTWAWVFVTFSRFL